MELVKWWQMGPAGKKKIIERDWDKLVSLQL